MENVQYMLWVFGLFIDIQGSYGTKGNDIYKEFTFPDIVLQDFEEDFERFHREKLRILGARCWIQLKIQWHSWRVSCPVVRIHE